MEKIISCDLICKLCKHLYFWLAWWKRRNLVYTKYMCAVYATYFSFESMGKLARIFILPKVAARMWDPLHFSLHLLRGGKQEKKETICAQFFSSTDSFCLIRNAMTIKINMANKRHLDSVEHVKTTYGKRHHFSTQIHQIHSNKWLFAIQATE